MSAPRRLQRERKRGWRMPSGAVYVGRPTCWGNPFVDWRSLMRPDEQAVVLQGAYARFFHGDGEGTPRDCVWYYEQWVLGRLPAVAGLRRLTDRALEIRTHIHELAGLDLMCWCPLDRRCHADVLLRLANKPQEG